MQVISAGTGSAFDFPSAERARRAGHVRHRNRRTLALPLRDATIAETGELDIPGADRFFVVVDDSVKGNGVRVEGPFRCRPIERHCVMERRIAPSDEPILVEHTDAADRFQTRDVASGHSCLDRFSTGYYRAWIPPLKTVAQGLPRREPRRTS